MRFSFWSLVVLAVTAAVAMAQPAAKKEAATATSSKEKSGDGQPQASEQKPATDTDEKSSKKNNKKPASAKPTLSEEEILKAISYMQGFGQGHQMYLQYTEQGIALDEETMIQAFKDGLAGKEPTMTEDQMKQVMPQIQKYVEQKYNEKARERAAINKQEGQDFLAENKKKEGVKTLQSGLQYKVLKSGKGETPKKSDTVKVHFKGNLIDGTEVESSHKKGAPATMQVSHVIPGWTEALQLMKVGDKWQLFIPANLAFKEEGRFDEQGREKIPPNAALIFEIELLSIEKGGKASPSPTSK